MMVFRKSHFFSPYLWMALGSGAVVLRLALAGRPDLIEAWYSRGLYLGIRWGFDHLLTWFPVPLLYLVVAAVLFGVVRGIRALRRDRPPAGVVLRRGALGLLAWIAALTFFFLFLWGFNYGRVPLERQLGLELEPLTRADLRHELEREAEAMIRWRQAIPGATDSALGAAALPPDLEASLRADLESRLRELGFPTVGRVRARRLYPKGIFLRFSSSGLYFPFTAEGHVDAGSPFLTLPYVMAHEMAHGYGFGDEGACSFLGYLSTTASPVPVIAYAGHLNYFRTVALQYLRQDPEGYAAFREALPAGIQADLNAINATLDRYPDIMPRLRYRAYDAYLKAQGIPEGILNYNRVAMLVRGWQQRVRM